MVLGLVANAAGVLTISVPGPNGEGASHAGPSSDAGASPGLASDPAAPTTAGSVWEVVYEGKDMHMDDFWIGDALCSIVEFDLDTLVGCGVIAADVHFDEVDLPDGDVDLAWDACTDWEHYRDGRG